MPLSIRNSWGESKSLPSAYLAAGIIAQPGLSKGFETWPGIDGSERGDHDKMVNLQKM